MAFLLDRCKIFWLGQIIQSLSKNSVWAFLTHIFHVLCYLSDFETSRLVIHQDGCNAPIAKYWGVQMYPLHPWNSNFKTALKWVFILSDKAMHRTVFSINFHSFISVMFSLNLFRNLKKSFLSSQRDVSRGLKRPSW